MRPFSNSLSKTFTTSPEVFILAFVSLKTLSASLEDLLVHAKSFKTCALVPPFAKTSNFLLKSLLSEISFKTSIWVSFIILTNSFSALFISLARFLICLPESPSFVVAALEGFNEVSKRSRI